MQADVIVLGAGIIGVSVALHLAERGRSVALVDRRGPGEETSFGNAGLIQHDSVVPYGFPQDLRTIVRHALNTNIDTHYHPTALPAFAAFMARYWWNSRSASHRRIAQLYAPLITNAVREHQGLIDKAGAGHLINKDGWVKAFRTEGALQAALPEAERLRSEFGVGHVAMAAKDFAAAEPDFGRPMAGAIRWSSSWAVRDPEALIKAYARHFESLGGLSVIGDATTLRHNASGRYWQVSSAQGKVEASEVVLALGPWADTVAKPLGYHLPIVAKRGYHMHYQPAVGKKLNNWLFDAEGGFMLGPMAKGIRLTTGVEFARRDARPTPVQLERAEAAARAVAPIGERIDVNPWVGARPCTPDMMPLLGPAPHHQGLWFALGHAHHGLTLGPVSGRLLAEQMLGETPFLDMHPYRPARFRI